MKETIRLTIQAKLIMVGLHQEEEKEEGSQVKGARVMPRLPGILPTHGTQDQAPVAIGQKIDGGLRLTGTRGETMKEISNTSGTE